MNYRLKALIYRANAELDYEKWISIVEKIFKINPDCFNDNAQSLDCTSIIELVLARLSA